MSRLGKTRRDKNRDMLRHAAIDLAYEHGIDNVTVEMICEKVGFSLRTFFNYFPYKEAAFAPKPMEFSAESVEIFASSNGALLDDFTILLRPIFETAFLNKQHIRKAHKVAHLSPKLLALRMNAFREFDNIIAEILTRRLTIKHKKPQAMHMAVLLTATIRLGFRTWIEQDEGDLAQIVEQKIKAINNIFD